LAETTLRTQLSSDENVLALLTVDLDAQLRFSQGLVALTDRGLLSTSGSGTEWQRWDLAPGLSLRHTDHAG